MKIKKFLILALLIILITPGCSITKDSMEDITIYTTIYPIKYLLDSLYGDNATINSIYPSGVDTNDYELSDKKLEEYSKTDLFVFNSLDKDRDYAVKMINKNKNLKVIDVSLGITYVDDITELWLNPYNYLMMAQNTKDGLLEYIDNPYLISNTDGTGIENKYEELKDALMKLRLNDAALIFEPETSQALGFGFRTGFLGLLHMDVIQERIEREFKIDLIATAPSVEYHVELTNGNEISIDNPSAMPDFTTIKKILEPYVEATIMVPTEYIGPIMELCQNKRGTFVDMKYIEQTRASIRYDIPLSEIVYDFFDRLKSSTKGYASLDYTLSNYRESNLVKMDILLNGERVDALSVIVHKDFAYRRGRALTQKLRGLIPRQQFEIPVQAAVNSKIIARENVAALRKDVLAKCYGGDISRKKKLLEKQKEGKKRMKQVGSVEIPQEAFLAVLQLDDEK